MRILITAGPTREFFDTVRFISNPSSGKMGYALAAAAVRRNHQAILVSGPVQLPEPPGTQVIGVVSAAQMAHVCKDLWHECDAGILTAAVCDYRPKRILDHKLKKKAAERRICLVPTEDIAATLGRTKGCRPLICFAMEDHDHHAHAEAKLRRKRCDAIVLNGPENIGGDHAVVQVLTAAGGWSAPFKAPKPQVAERIISLAESLLARSATPIPRCDSRRK
ncbi:MAG: phosphopantothenoylcysteine decarboxylase [Phycisphaerales bacterium]|nr:MAG: phosphopantothenoylcysteine decarboxylase [Phycisphaerales bacterium]